MQSHLTKANKKVALIVVAVVLIAAVLAIVATVSLQAAYERRSRAEIVDFGEVVALNDEGSYVYRYDEGVDSVDLATKVTVNAGASFCIVKIKDEDGLVTKGSGTSVDVSTKPLRTAVVRVSSENGKNTADYAITVAPRSSENNRINYYAVESVSDEYLLTYSGEVDVVLPTPKKTYTSPATGNVVDFPFEGWYTDPAYSEESKVTSVPQGSEGEITLYARFADKVIYGARDGYKYIYYGEMPQSRVTNYNLMQALRRETTTQGAFTYDGNKYYCYRPNNVPNLAENGYSSASAYYFKYEPIEWRILKEKDFNFDTLTSSDTVTLMATCILGGGKYCENGGMVQNAYQSVANSITAGEGMDNFENYFFDGNTMYHGGEATAMKYTGIRDTVLDLYNTYMSFTSTSPIQNRSFQYYTNITNGTGSYNDPIWLMDFDEVLTASYGFNEDYRVNDAVRKAWCTDFAAAQGVYRSTSRGTENQGSWWLRGGSKRKTVAYVKYTGYVHRYTASNYAVLSGIRPCMDVKYDMAYFTESDRA